MSARTLSSLAVALLLAVFGPDSVAGQAGASSLLPDRPGIGDAVYVLAPGFWQAEVGVQRSAGGGATVYTLGQGVLRYGLSGYELRIYPSSFVASGAPADVTGFSDPGIGFKAGLKEAANARYSTVVFATLPVGSDAFSAGEASVSARIVAEVPLGETGAITVNGGYAFLIDEFVDGNISFIATPSFPISSVEGLAWYAGYAGLVTSGPAQHFIEAGLAYTTDLDTQLDLNAGWDANGDTWFLGVGLARRWR